MWEPARDFAWFKVPKASTLSGLGGEKGGAPGRSSSGTGSGLGSTAPLKSVVAMSHNSPQVMVVTNEGHFYVFGIDLENGGEGSLLRVHEVGGDGEASMLGDSVMEK